MAKVVLTPEAGISIIGQSLKQTTNQKTGASNYYIIWGTVLFIFYTIQFLVYHFQTTLLANIAGWSMLVYPIGGLLSFIQSKRDKKTETMVPLNEKLYTYSGASLTLGTLCIGNIIHFQETLCIGTLIIFGLINFIIGGMTKFKPLIIGGAISIVLSVAIPHLTLDYKFLMAAIGILCTCLVPGILMKNTDANV